MRRKYGVPTLACYRAAKSQYSALESEAESGAITSAWRRLSMQFWLAQCVLFGMEPVYNT